MTGAYEAIGQSDAFLECMERLSRVATVNRPVLVVGERGTGKELAAGRIHYLSERWQGPFVALNSSAIAPSLVESELFGHEAGAFTGAVRRRAGRFEAADGGTLFLDEIAAMPMTAQEKILRVVEYGEFERVGGVEPVQSDVRIVGATNADLPQLAREGQFKHDLLDRLSFEVVTVPPLRFRKGDVPLLAAHFAARMAVEMGLGDAPGFSASAIAALETYNWPGNVRELRNVVERAVYKAGGRTVDELVFDPFLSPWREDSDEISAAVSPMQAVASKQSPSDSDAPFVPGAAVGEGGSGADLGLRDAVRELEVRMVRNALTQTRHNQKKAAQLLGLSYDQFRGLFRKYKGELDVP